MRFVLDASVTLCWVLEGQATAETNDLLRGMVAGDQATAPFIWPVEVIHVLLNAERQRSISLAEVNTFLRRLDEFQVQIESQGVFRCFDGIIAAARENRLTG